MEQYELEKWIWTEADFHVMGWHDATVHAFAFIPEKFELLLDIDYILQWVHPQEGETYFKFWVAPATLVFEGVYDPSSTWSPSQELNFRTFEEPILKFRQMPKLLAATKSGDGPLKPTTAK